MNQMSILISRYDCKFCYCKILSTSVEPGWGGNGYGNSIGLNCALFPCFPGDKAMDGYSKKKYVCKLLFIFLLGHDIDFGHMEAVNLLSSNRYTEKQIVSNSISIK